MYYMFPFFFFLTLSTYLASCEEKEASLHCVRHSALLSSQHPFEAAVSCSRDSRADNVFFFGPPFFFFFELSAYTNQFFSAY
jgi:hypothetical protein